MIQECLIAISHIAALLAFFTKPRLPVHFLLCLIEQLPWWHLHFFFISCLFVLSISFLFSSIDRRPAYATHLKHIHNKHPHAEHRLITPITAYFYLQPNVTLWSDTWRMFAVHPLHACTTSWEEANHPHNKTTSFSTLVTLSFSFFFSLAPCLTLPDCLSPNCFSING